MDAFTRRDEAPACASLPPVFQESSTKPQGSLLPSRRSDALCTLEKYSPCEKTLDEGFKAGRGRFASTLACEKKYRSGKVPWKWVSIIAAGDGLVCRGGATAGRGPRRPHTAMGGMSPQELAVPSCGANVTVRCRSQAGRLTQLLRSRPPPARILCAQPHTNCPSLGGPGNKREMYGPMRPAAPRG